MISNQEETLQASAAWIFPGQGSQQVGMGAGLRESHPEARLVFDEADDVLGFRLSTLCFEGPADVLQQTVNAQPAILTASVAWLRVLEAQGALPRPGFVAGHSLGEYTALVAAGSLSFADAVRLVRERGGLMETAGNGRASGMAAVIGLDDSRLEDICRHLLDSYPDSGLQVANFNSPGQTVISGAMDALEAAMAAAKREGARRVLPLPVSAAFHSGLMQSMAEPFASALSGVPIAPPAVPLVANVTARPLHEPDEIRAELVQQTFSPVQWLQSVRYMVAAGVIAFAEIGPGAVLSGLVKRISGDVQVLDSEAMQDVLAQRTLAS